MKERPTQSNAFDVTTIPVSLLDRIEAPTDGVSAIYGSDAVANVVIIMTHHDPGVS
jgi:iron complex outermembrane receptor protein